MLNAPTVRKGGILPPLGINTHIKIQSLHYNMLYRKTARGPEPKHWNDPHTIHVSAEVGKLFHKHHPKRETSSSEVGCMLGLHGTTLITIHNMHGVPPVQSAPLLYSPE